jgi:spermidine synthase
MSATKRASTRTPAPNVLPPFAAAALVFLSSAAVLVLEILAARLLAPYVGDTLETYTAIIGVILGGIALGSWLGGKAADRTDPRSLIGPLLVTGGALAFLTIPLVDVLGSSLRGAGALTTTALTVIAFFAPAAVLTAINPAVIKIQLASLDETGRVVGRLSAISTAGAIIGTFATGFLLVAAAPTRPTIRVVGLLLVLGGIGVGLWLKRGRVLTATSVLGVLGAAVFSFAAAHPCEYESAYYCAYVVEDPDREGGLALHLDTLRHSYVDLDDPSYLGFVYTQWFGDVTDALEPDGGAIDTLHVGGGGFTMPRYLQAEHPGSRSTVLEVDPLLLELSQDELGLEVTDDLEVLLGDARLTIADTPSDAFDLVIGDAFGGVAVPWHLTTLEFTELVHDRLRPGGTYVMNVVDYGDRGFLRAEIATVAEVFDQVAVLGRAGSLDPDATGVGGNYVVIASDDDLPLEAIRAANERRGRDDDLVTGEELDAFVDGARVLTDDHAPVDQLLTPLPDA